MTQFEMQQKTRSLIAVDPAAVAAAETAKAKIQAGYLMALQKPRDEDEARAKILKACRRMDFAKDVEFKKPMGKKKVGNRWEQQYIDGMSIRFAEVALKEWGNVLTDVSTLYEDELVRRIKISVTDYETNLTHSREPQISKTVERRSDYNRDVLGERTNSNGDTVYIVRATDDELMNKENAIISKTIRNEGLRLIPNDIKVEAVRIARETVMADMGQDPDAAKKKLIDSFSSVSVMPKDLAKYLGHGLDVISPKELENLRGIYKAIKDGESSWFDFAGAEPADDETGATPWKPEDFDNEFETEMADPEWKGFWQKSVDWHAHQKPPKTGAELKIDIMRGGHEQIGRVRAAFVEFVTEKQTQNKDEKQNKRKRRTKKEIEADNRKAELKEHEKMLKSDAWAGCQAYSEEFKEIYENVLKEVTGGDPPKTIKECEAIIDRCQAAANVQDARDDIPC